MVQYFHTRYIFLENSISQRHALSHNHSKDLFPAKAYASYTNAIADLKYRENILKRNKKIRPELL